MLMIRLQRTGRRNIPTFRLVVIEKHSSPQGGKIQEYVGHYLPARDPAVFECARERIEHWLKVGAQPSDTAARLLSRAGVKGLERYITPYTKKKKKGEAAEGVKEGTPAKVEAPAKADDKEPKAA